MAEHQHTPTPWSITDITRYVGDDKLVVCELRRLHASVLQGDTIASFVGANARADAFLACLAVNAHADLVRLIKDAQGILADYLPPDGLSKDEAINRLLTLLDGPQSRAALAKADAP